MASSRVDQRARDLHSPMMSAFYPEVGSLPAVQWQPVAADGGQMLPYFCPAQEGRKAPAGFHSPPQRERRSLSEHPWVSPAQSWSYMPILNKPLARDDSIGFRPLSMRKSLLPH